jgi:alkanesulfonate monooxygenase SsuD/methylene tetrahydromethanopterin reductase-like flavin-dependent oxidoreductase (luciferase family)
VQELIGYFGDIEGAAIRAIPGVGTHVPVWIRSVAFTCQLAAHLGLPYASHFAPAMLELLSIYRTAFKPSQFLSRPMQWSRWASIAAEIDEEAKVLRSSQELAFTLDIRSAWQTAPYQSKMSKHTCSRQSWRKSDKPYRVPRRVHLRRSKAQLSAIIDKYRPTSFGDRIHDHAARVRSFEIVVMS